MQDGMGGARRVIPRCGFAPFSSQCSSKCYQVHMNALRAHVVNGRIVVDEPVDLPEGAEVRVQTYDPTGDSLSDEDRAALHRSLRRGIAQADAGDLVDADDVLAELERRRASYASLRPFRNSRESDPVGTVRGGPNARYRSLRRAALCRCSRAAP